MHLGQDVLRQCGPVTHARKQQQSARRVHIALLYIEVNPAWGR